MREDRGGRTRHGGTLGLALLTLVASCVGSASMRVRAQRNPAAEFGRYATYAWATPPLGPTVGGDARGGGIWASAPSARESAAAQFDWQLRGEIDGQLAQRGYAQVGTRDADVLVDYRIRARDKEIADRMGEYSRYRAEGGQDAWGDVWMHGYQEGELAILVIDARTRAWVWQGTATAVVNPSLRERRVPEAARRLFQGFPARATP